jgi:hypothetical protein
MPIRRTEPVTPVRARRPPLGINTGGNACSELIRNRLDWMAPALNNCVCSPRSGPTRRVKADGQRLLTSPKFSLAMS